MVSAQASPKAVSYTHLGLRFRGRGDGGLWRGGWGFGLGLTAFADGRRPGGGVGGLRHGCGGGFLRRIG